MMVGKGMCLSEVWLISILDFTDDVIEHAHLATGGDRQVPVFKAPGMSFSEVITIFFYVAIASRLNR